ncbi:hypothetical protein [Sphingobacterium sp. HSC-15S19]|uniref:hypothetical protein n=1 Tax=Sphingobacterium sp. HSC-15S19 TaxID=2910971 RepID=UPI003D25BF13
MTTKSGEEPFSAGTSGHFIPKSGGQYKRNLHKDNIFKVTGLLKKGRFRMEELNSGRFFALTKNDELYRSLINCKQQLQQTRIKDSKPDLEPVKEDISVPVPKR